MVSFLLDGVRVAIALLWLPILFKFIRAWHERRNPISLAICGLILFVMYRNVIRTLADVYNYSPLLENTMVTGTHLLVCLNFYLAFYFTRRRFPDARSSPSISP